MWGDKKNIQDFQESLQIWTFFILFHVFCFFFYRSKYFSPIFFV